MKKTLFMRLHARCKSHVTQGLLILFTSLVVGSSCLRAQGGWTQPRGGLFAKVDWSYLNATEFANHAGDLLDTSQFVQHNVNIYAEYGLTDRFTVMLQGPLIRSNRLGPSTAAAGLGDLRVDVKYRLTSNDLPVAVSVGVELPTGNPDLTRSLSDVPEDIAYLPTGDGEWNVWTTLAASKGWRRTYLSGFASANLRSRYRDFEFVNLFLAGVEFGFRPSDPLWLSARIRGQWREGPSSLPDGYFLYGDATTYTLTSLEAYYAFADHWGATLAFLSGGNLLSEMRNLYLAPVISLGVVYRQTP